MFNLHLLSVSIYLRHQFTMEPICMPYSIRISTVSVYSSVCRKLSIVIIYLKDPSAGDIVSMYPQLLPIYNVDSTVTICLRYQSVYSTRTYQSSYNTILPKALICLQYTAKNAPAKKLRHFSTVFHTDYKSCIELCLINGNSFLYPLLISL
jgi:hypothetical protein